MKKLLLFTLLLYSTFVIYSQNKAESKIHLWEPKSFCDIPENINIHYGIYCNYCKWDYVDCEKIDKKQLKAVHITFSSKTDSTFELTSKFKNISLKRKTNNKIIHPYAILMAKRNEDPKTNELIYFMSYMVNKFTAKKYIIDFKLNLKYDLILLFDEAETGDVLTIDNFIQNEIE